MIKAKSVDADIVLASDPDADRVGSAVKNDKGEWMLLNGNQTGMILTYYLLRRWKELGKLKGKEFVVKTIVTTELIKKIADKANVPCFDVYTDSSGLPMSSASRRARCSILVVARKATAICPKIL